MTPAALGPALFTPPPADTGSALTADTGTATGDGGFARLLHPAPAAAGDAAPPASGLAEAGLADIQTLPAAEADSGEDAPWPPLGLETLLAVPATAPVPNPSAGLGQASTAATPALPATPVLAQPAMPLAPATQVVATGLPATPLASQPGHSANLQADAVAPLVEAGMAASEDALGSRLAANPTNVQPLPGTESPPLASLAAVVATAGASPLSATDTQATVVPTRADMGGEHFDQEVAEGVQYMLDNKLQSARIRISPQQMGMIEVELRLDGDRVHANFSSAQADVRQALHDSLPRLRELLDGQGLAMGETAVGDHGQHNGESGSGQEHGPAAHTAAAPHADPNAVQGRTAGTWQRAGLLDAYA